MHVLLDWGEGVSTAGRAGGIEARRGRYQLSIKVLLMVPTVADGSLATRKVD